MSTIAKALIKSAVERLENIQVEIDELNDAKKEIYADAKGNGLDVWAIKEIVKIRKAKEKADPVKDAERQQTLDTYMLALGMIDAIARAPARGDDSSDGHHPPQGGPAVNAPSAGSGAEVLPVKNSPEEATDVVGGVASACSATFSRRELDAHVSESDVTDRRDGQLHSSAAETSPENAADTTEGANAFGLSSNHVAPALGDVTAEEASPPAPIAASSALHTQTQPVRTSGKGDRLPVPPPRHSDPSILAPEIPTALRRGKDNRAPFQRTETSHEAIT